MTRLRIYGEDSDFSNWMRSNKRLPSFSRDCGFVSTDNDFTIHRYLTAVDKQGTREVQGLMHIEAKTRGAVPTQSQADTLLKLDMFRGQRVHKSHLVRHFGVSIVSMSGTSPDNSSVIRWGRFKKGQLGFVEITVSQLEDLLLFEKHPDSLLPNPYRRHHKLHEIVVEEHLPLGFSSLRKLSWSS